MIDNIRHTVATLGNHMSNCITEQVKQIVINEKQHYYADGIKKVAWGV